MGRSVKCSDVAYRVKAGPEKRFFSLGTPARFGVNKD